jgi:hypothetical protein
LNIGKILYSQYSNRNLIQKAINICGSDNIKLFIDSGAWTAFTCGAKINIDEYIWYLNQNVGKFSVIAPLDVLPSGIEDADKCAEESWHNFVYMRKRLIDRDKLIAVYHQGEAIDFLIRMLTYEDEYGKLDYIGLGALANTLDYKTRDVFIEKCFSIIMKYNPTIKVHAFGMTDLRLLELYPFTSADSSTYVMAAGMGELVTKFGRVPVSYERGDRIKKDSVAGKLLDEYISSLGFDYDVLAASRIDRVRFNVAYFKNWEANYVCKYKAVQRKKLF